MARNGSGTYSLAAGNPVVTGTVISSTIMNNTLNDIATALTQSVAKDGQTPITANIPLAGFKLTGVGAPTATGDALSEGRAIGGTTPAAITATTITASGAVTIGDAIGDAFTINAGAWSIPNDIDITTSSGALAAGTSIMEDTTNTFSGHSGGTSDRRGRLLTLNATGTANIASQYTQYTNCRNNLTSGTIAAGIAHHANVYNLGAGVTTTAVVYDGHIRVDGTGGMTSAYIYNIPSCVYNGTGRVPTIYGFRSGAIGHATLVDTAVHFHAPDTSATASVVGFDSQVTSGTGKFAFRSLGSAQSVHAGLFGFGATTSPVNTVDITGSLGRGAPVTKTADFTVGASENWIICNKSGSTCTVTLPTASSWTRRELMLKCTQPQTVVSASSNVVDLDGNVAGTAILSGSGKWCTLISDGTNWVMMAGVI